jgi:glucuronate isomerase
LLAQSGFATRVLPSLRADDVVAVESPAYLPWLKQLGEATGMAIDCFEAFACAVARRLDAFDQLGCRLADHGLDDFSYVTAGENETAALFATRLGGDRLSPLENVQLKSGLCRFLGLQYARRNWSMQLHLGAHRRTSSRLRDLAGPAGGYAAMGPGCDIASLCRFLDDLERAGGLPRTVLYCLNPADNAALAVLTGSYAQDGVRGKIQFGPAWWYNDHASGIRQQLETAANFGLLSTFVGMTTDSRSLLSMTRHEYFRRVLCDFVGDQVEAGIWPADETLLGQAVRAVAYENARRWILSAET